MWKLVRWVCLISFSFQVAMFTLTGNPNHYLFIIPLIGIIYSAYKEATTKTDDETPLLEKVK